MKIRTAVLSAAIIIFAFSCAGAPKPLPPKFPPPEKPETRREISVIIASPGNRTESELAVFLVRGNPAVTGAAAREFARLYIEEAVAEGINHDIAFCQMALETGFLKFGGTVRPEQNNFCGLGVLDANTPGEIFPTARIGVRAHIQHLKAYAGTDTLRHELVDRRFKWVKRGSAPTIYDLAGRWAADPEYGRKIHDLLERLFLVRTADLARKETGRL
jgi:hypothetical protein